MYCVVPILSKTLLWCSLQKGFDICPDVFGAMEDYKGCRQFEDVARLRSACLSAKHGDKRFLECFPESFNYINSKLKVFYHRGFLWFLAVGTSFSGFSTACTASPSNLRHLQISKSQPNRSERPSERRSEPIRIADQSESLHKFLRFYHILLMPNGIT